MFHVEHYSPVLDRVYVYSVEYVYAIVVVLMMNNISR